MRFWVGTAACIGLAVAALLVASGRATSQGGSVSLSPCRVDGVGEELRCGVLHVLENRQARHGRSIPLKIIVIPARRPDPVAAPVFALLGGPGETATEAVGYMIGAGVNEANDVVLVDQRGTGDGHRLDCPAPWSDDNLQAYLEASFDPVGARACRQLLEQDHDLSRYGTADFVEDLEEVRRALGHERINIEAGSFGTYAALMYMRKYGGHVRAAFLRSLVTRENRVPLYHAWAAQHGLDALFDQCERDPDCRAAYPRFRENFAAVMRRLEQAPADAWTHHPVSGARVPIRLSRAAFANAVRVMTYSAESARRLPFLIERAMAGDFTPFADTGVRATRDMLSALRMGLNYSVTCTEFVARIRPQEVGPATAGSYFGDLRVRNQMALCAEWPRTHLPPGFFEPFVARTHAVLVSGDADPASPPRWGEAVRAFMPNAVHIIVPGAGHIPDNACTRSLRRQLFRAGSTRDLDLGCVAAQQAPPFFLPPAGDSGG